MENTMASAMDVLVLLGGAALIGSACLWVAVVRSLHRLKASGTHVFLWSHLIALGLYVVAATIHFTVVRTSAQNESAVKINGVEQYAMKAVLLECMAVVIGICKCARLEDRATSDKKNTAQVEER